MDVTIPLLFLSFFWHRFLRQLHFLLQLSLVQRLPYLHLSLYSFLNILSNLWPFWSSCWWLGHPGEPIENTSENNDQATTVQPLAAPNAVPDDDAAEFEHKADSNDAHINNTHDSNQRVVAEWEMCCCCICYCLRPETVNLSLSFQDLVIRYQLLRKNIFKICLINFLGR